MPRTFLQYPISGPSALRVRRLSELSGKTNDRRSLWHATRTQNAWKIKDVKHWSYFENTCGAGTANTETSLEKFWFAHRRSFACTEAVIKRGERSTAVPSHENLETGCDSIDHEEGRLSNTRRINTDVDKNRNPTRGGGDGDNRPGIVAQEGIPQNVP